MGQGVENLLGYALLTYSLAESPCEVSKGHRRSARTGATDPAAGPAPSTPAQRAECRTSAMARGPCGGSTRSVTGGP